MSDRRQTNKVRSEYGAATVLVLIALLLLMLAGMASKGARPMGGGAPARVIATDGLATEGGRSSATGRGSTSLTPAVIQEGSNKTAMLQVGEPSLHKASDDESDEMLVAAESDSDSDLSDDQTDEAAQDTPTEGTDEQDEPSSGDQGSGESDQGEQGDAQPDTSDQPGQADQPSQPEQPEDDQPKQDQPKQDQSAQDKAGESTDSGKQNDQKKSDEVSAQHGKKTLEKKISCVNGTSYTIKLTYDEKANIPDNAELKLVELNRSLTKKQKEDKANKNRPYDTERFVSETALKKRGEVLDRALKLTDNDYRYFTKYMDIMLVADGQAVVPDAPVEVVIETKAVPRDQAGTLEIALMEEVKNPTKKDPYAYKSLGGKNETDKKDSVSKVSFTTDKLGEFTVIGVAYSMGTWDVDGMKVNVMGPRDLKSANMPGISVDTGDEGLQLRQAFNVQVNPSPEYGTTLWISAKPIDGAQNQDKEGGLYGYRVKEGALADRLFDPKGTKKPIKFSSDKEGIALVWDTGYRHQSFGIKKVALDGMLPEGVSVTATSVRKDYRNCAAISKKLTKAAEALGATLDTVAAYDISMTAGGLAYQPSKDKPIKVSISSVYIKDDGLYQVWHVRDDGSVELVEDAAFEGDTVTFEATDLNVFMVVETTIETTLETADGKTYRVQVTYDNTTGIPEDAELKVSEIKEGQKAYKTYVKKAAQALDTKVENLLLTRAFNITLKDSATGREYQPSKDVRVSIELLGEDMSEHENVRVVHIPSTPDAQPEVIDVTVNGEAVEFSTDGFSVYVVTDTERTPYDTLPEAIGVAEDGDTIELDGDYINAITTDKNLTIDLNGHALTVENDGIVSQTGGSLTFVNGTMNASSTAVVTANGGSITLGEGLIVDAPLEVHTDSGGQVSIAGAIVNDTVTVTGGSNLTMSDGTIYGAVSVTDGSALTVSGGTIDEAVSLENGSTLTVDGGTIDNQVAVGHGSTMVLSDGVIAGAVTASDGSNLTVSGGIVDNDISITSGSLTITGGTITGAISADDSATVTVSGGTFSQDQELNPDWIEQGAEEAISYINHDITVTANSNTKVYDGTELTDDGYSVKGLLDGYTLEGVVVTGVQTDAGESANTLSGSAVIKNTRGEDVTEGYDVHFVNGTLTVTKRPITVKITGRNSSAIYNGEEHSVSGYIVEIDDDAITEEDLTFSGTASVTRTNAGTTNMNLDAENFAVGEELRANYDVTFDVIDGYLTINPAPVTLTGNSKVCIYDGTTEYSVSGFTSSVEGLTFEGVSASASGIEKGVYPVEVSGVTLNETTDTTSNYVVTETVPGELIVAVLVEKELTGFEGNHAEYEIRVNPYSVRLNKDQDITLKDTFTDKQSIYYDSVTVSDDRVTYDYRENTGTFTIPDGTAVTITYTTRVLASAGETLTIGNTASLGVMEDEEFEPWGSVTVSEECTVEPAESEISGESGVYTIKVFTYADGHMERGLSGAEFRLLDYNQNPITYKKGDKAGQQVTYVTGDDGYVTVTLSEENDGISIHKNTVYYLEMIKAPVADNGNGTYTYYQKDNTLLNFLITDNPEYSTGESGIYSYFNGDVLKVRCYEESVGINVTARFSGNYTPTDEEKNRIVFILEKENTLTGGWDEVERHSYSEFKWGSMQFNEGKEGWALSDYGVTFRVRETEADIEGINLHTSCVVSSQSNGETISEELDEFLVDPDHQAYSFSLTFTNEYFSHKLTFYAIDEELGDLLQNAKFSTYKVGETEPVAVYTTGADGTTDITYDDAYDTDTLYYAVQTAAPDGYMMPDNPEKVYFYFSENNQLVPSGLPAGETALDLSETFYTVAVANTRIMTHFPVIVAWGRSGIGTWPDTVDHVLIELYKSVDGGDNAPEGKSVELNAQNNFDNTTFTELPLRDGDGHKITYTLVETIFDANGTDVTDQYAVSDTVSSSGWHVIRNQGAVVVTVHKTWFDMDDTTEVAAPSDVTAVRFDLYRTTEQISADAALSREELLTALDDASSVRVRKDITASAADNWTVTIPSLQETDSGGNTYYYYVLEDESTMARNHVDSYAIADGNELTIRNTQTPVTVTIQAPRNASKTYGEEDPTYAKAGEDGAEPDFPFVIDVQADGASATCAAIDAEAGTYAVAVTVPGEEAKTLNFTLTRDSGENVGNYALMPSGETSQEGYRVVYKAGRLTINRAEVTVTAGKDAEGNDLTKTYGDADPALAVVEGMQFQEDQSLIRYECYRVPGEDVGTYHIYVNGDANQGNYHVTFTEGELTITRAEVTVRPDVRQGKTYGESDPELTATVFGLTAGDAAGVIQYTITRQSGENVGSYDIIVEGEAVQDNYNVTFLPGTFTITPASLTVSVADAEVIYGDESPEWDITIDGLTGDDEIADGSPTVSGSEYTYTLTDGKTIKFTLTSGAQVDIGEWPISLTGESEQGNYTVEFESGMLYIRPAHLTVTADDIVKDVNEPTDPPLTATVAGWKLNDGKSTFTRTESGGVATYVYALDGETLLEFTVSRASGTAEGDYAITPAGNTIQGNYEVEYVDGTFSILSVYNIDVRQVTVDRVDAAANPSYEYEAEVDLTGTGLTEMTGFELVSGSIWKKDFTLPGDGTDSNLETLKIPIGAKLTVKQKSNHNAYADDYETAITLDGDPYTAAEQYSCIVPSVDDYYAIAFTHTRICLPVTGMAGATKAEEGAVAVSPSGFTGIPSSSQEGQSIDNDYVRTLERQAGYSLPTDKYYKFNHAALYHEASEGEEGTRIGDVVAIRYAADDSGVRQWQYKAAADGSFTTMPEDAVLRLYYYPEYVCQIDTDPGEGRSMQKFYTLNAALEYLQGNEAFIQEDGTTKATIEMLLEDFAMPVSDTLTIPAGYEITLATAQSDYEGTQGSRATISRSLALSGNMFVNNGTLILADIILDGNGGEDGVQGADAMVKNVGNLSVSEDAALQNANGVNGGAIYMASGVAEVSGSVCGNTATYGGAIYVAAGEVVLMGTIGGSKEDANTATNGGAVFMTGGAVKVEDGTVSYNSATEGNDGGVFYVEGGTVEITGGTVSNNSATNGGMLYATGGDVTISGGTVRDNHASTGNGGAIYYGGPGTVTISGGTVQGNTAENGYGGAVYQSSGTVTVSGTIDGENKAKNGAAIFVASGITNFEGASITGNKATDPSGGAVGVDSQARLYFSGNTKVTGNSTTGSGSGQRNVYLDEDSDEIINAPSAGLGDNADIGIYVDNGVYSKRGDVCCSFGSYVGTKDTKNLDKFKDDRGDYSVYNNENKLYWGKALSFNVFRQDTGFPTGTNSGTRLYPASNNTNQSYYPKKTNNEIYDLVISLYNEFYHDSIKSGYVYSYCQVNNNAGFEKRITSIDWDADNKVWVFTLYDGTTVSDQTLFRIYYQNAAYISITNNDSHDLTVSSLTVRGKDAGTTGYGYVVAINGVSQTTLNPVSAEALVIPAGGSVRLLFPGATGASWSVEGTFSGAGEDTEIKYALNGGQSQTLSLTASGEFTLDDTLSSDRDVVYDILFGDPTPICKVEDSTGDHPFTSLNAAKEFITNAETHAEGEEYYQPADGKVTVATIQMLIDYQQPKTDILAIPEGYDITLTTADPTPAEPVAGKYYYDGVDDTRATISRSSGDMGSAVTALIQDGTAVLTPDADDSTQTSSEPTTRLTVSSLIFDGKALGQGGEGGAIKSSNVIVGITSCDFKGYTASRGGAIYTKWGKLTVEHSNFENCRVYANEDKTGGGGVWTTAKELKVDDCDFSDCYGQSQAQGSAIFHNIRNDGAVVHPKDSQEFPTGFSNGSTTTVSNCHFENCTANGSGGTIESDAWSVYITDCTFNGSQTLKSGGNGGAINIYTNDSKSIPATGRVEIRRCQFTDCSAPNGNTNGGAIRTLSPILIVEDSLFSNAFSKKTGGAISMTNAGSQIQITGCTFENCSAETDSGAVKAYATKVDITDSLFKNCTAPKYGGIYQERNTDKSKVTVTDSSFENCTSTNSDGGALYVVGKELEIAGKFKGKTLAFTDIEDNDITYTYDAVGYTFKNCTASGNGGAVYHAGATSTQMTDCVFDSCASESSGGAAYLTAPKLTASGIHVSGCKAVTSGGGLYISPGSTVATFTDGCELTGNWVTATDGKGGSLFINQNTVTITGGTVSNSKAAMGGGIYQKGTLNLNGTSISDCYAVLAGGGLYHEGTVSAYGSISHCFAKQGGGVYSAGNLSFTNASNDMSVSNCYATTVTLNEDGTTTPNSTTTVSDYYNTLDNLGGGVYNGSGTFSQSRASIVGCQAYDGGGVYQAGGTYTLSGGTVGASEDESIPGNNAINNGGGVYHAGGTFDMNSGSIVSNTATNKGAGVYVADGQTMNVATSSNSCSEIARNHADTEGGGIAVGGSSAVLKFAGYVLVEGNTQGEDNETCNVYLNQDTNRVIQTSAALTSSSYIGVYVIDSLMDDHGLSGMPFGTYANASNLDRFLNDREQYLYGTEGSNNLIVWVAFVCKITDADGNLLYRDEACTLPAVYPKLENSLANSAFSALTSNTLYGKKPVDGEGQSPQPAGESYSGPYQVQMLVQDYSTTQQITLSGSKTVTLTTASTTEDECGFKYTGDQKHPYAAITRTAGTESMITVNSSNFTLRGVIIDGGYEPDKGRTLEATSNGGILYSGGNSNVTISENATLRNSRTTAAGGAVRMQSSGTLTLEGSGKIEKCESATWGGGVSVKSGTFNMTGGTITGCSGQFGGGVRVDTTMRMSGGEIVDNIATDDGGGISMQNAGAKVYFSGDVVVRDNTLNGTTCNVQLSLEKNYNANTVVQKINTTGLGADAYVGVYTTGQYYTNHGEQNDPFGTWTGDSCLYNFVNDVNGLCGGKMSDKKIYWLGRPMLEITKTVDSDWSVDKTRDFSFIVTLAISAPNDALVDYGFNRNGVATFTLNDGESRSLSLPTSLLGTGYTVVEDLEGETEFTTSIQKDAGPVVPGVREITGTLGENVDGSEQSTSTTVIHFTNTRVKGDFTISKSVESKEEADVTTREYAFAFALEDSSINKTYACTKSYTQDGEIIKETTETTALTFINGVAQLHVKNGQSFTIEDLPKGIGYTVTESLGSDKNLFTTRVGYNGGDSSLVDGDNRSGAGVIGEKTAKDEHDHDYYYSTCEFINIKLDVVCKITDRNRNLLYYKDSGELVPAVYFRLEDAFDQVNKGGLRTSNDGTVSGTLRIEMVVTAYAMERSASLNTGKTVILSTALIGDEDYPYNLGHDDETGNVSVVTRGYNGDSMIVSAGTLTVDAITLDGGSESDEHFKSTSNGGIIQVVGSNRLTINNATNTKGEGITNLRNSNADGFNGGAIWLGEDAQITMNGTIENCSALNGGGIYADGGFRSITIGGTASDTGGTISGCEAVTDAAVDHSGHGGAIYAGAGTSGITLNTSAQLEGNHADKDGGAVWSDATVTLRGQIASNTADGNGGGMRLGEGVSLTMAGGSFTSNKASNGGALVVLGTASISSGSFSGNEATGTAEGQGQGGAIYVGPSATVTIRGTATELSGNVAKLGGAISSQGAVTMSGGIMQNNRATVGGSAVYVEAGSFTMTGGKIQTNYSDKGAVFTGDKNDSGVYPELNFSGSAYIYNNTTMESYGNATIDPTPKMNVYLGYDTDAIIRTTGLGSNASIGVYVADGENYNLLYAHGIADRNFGTYTGTNPQNANLKKFSNDRDDDLTGVDGELQDENVEGVYFVMWPGKSLYIQVRQFDIQMGSDGKPVTDDNGKYVPADPLEPVAGASFTFTNTTTGEVVWSGASDGTGLVTVPWSKIEDTGSNTAIFKQNSTYILEQQATGDGCVRPSGSWKLDIELGNHVTWTTNHHSDEEAGLVNRTLDISALQGELGDTFTLYNDREPRITFDANGGTLYSDSKADSAVTVKTEDVEFGVSQTESVAYTITEKDPVRSSKFLNWAEVEDPKETDIKYVKGDTLTFVRKSDYDDVTLYAQWVPVVCKITDRNNNLLYIDGQPAIYAKLEEAFADFNSSKKFTLANGRAGTARKIQMLVDEYKLLDPVTLERGKTAILTTASTTDAEYPADTGVTTCTIKRNYDAAASMITNKFSLTLMNITLDGSKNTYTTPGKMAENGGIVTVVGDYAALSIGAGATLMNAAVSGNGGAVYAADETTVTIVDGVIIGNEASAGAGIYLTANSTLHISGNPSFGDGTAGSPANTVPKADYSDKLNGNEEVYTDGRARQDIYITETIEKPASVIVSGNLTGADGSIWVWATSEYHYKQLMPFAKLDGGVSGGNLMAFRNAQPDDLTENGSDTWLGGTTEGETAGYVYWSGSSGKRKVILRKVDSSGASMAGKLFTVYKGESETAYTPQGAMSPMSELVSGESGCFYIGTLPYGWYIIEEASPHRFFYLVIVESGTYGTLDESNEAVVGGYESIEAARIAAKSKYGELR